MKHVIYTILITIEILCLASCKSAPIQPNREFFTNFSIGEIVAENDTNLLPGSRVLNGQEAGPVEPFVQRYEEINLQIEPAKLPSFLEAVQADIRDEIAASGATVQGYGQGGGSNTEYFTLDYAYDQIFGTIHVWAVDGKGNDLTIIVLLTEEIK